MHDGVEIVRSFNLVQARIGVDGELRYQGTTARRRGNAAIDGDALVRWIQWSRLGLEGCAMKFNPVVTVWTLVFMKESELVTPLVLRLPP